MKEYVFFPSCHKGHKEKKVRILTRNTTSDLQIPRPSALPLSHIELRVSHLKSIFSTSFPKWNKYGDAHTSRFHG